MNDFEDSWNQLHDKYGTTIPNKVHIITHHLPAVLKKTKKTLKGLSDQTMESVHQCFNSRMTASNYVVKNINSRAHGRKLLAGTNHYNCFAIGCSK